MFLLFIWSLFRSPLYVLENHYGSNTGLIFNRYNTIHIQDSNTQNLETYENWNIYMSDVHMVKFKWFVKSFADLNAQSKINEKSVWIPDKMVYECPLRMNYQGNCTMQCLLSRVSLWEEQSVKWRSNHNGNHETGKDHAERRIRWHHYWNKI